MLGPQHPLPGAWQLTELLQPLQPGRLTVLILDTWLPAAEIAAHLAQPDATAEWRAFNIAAQLRQHTALQALGLKGALLGDQVVPAVGSLRQLERLSLEAEFGLPDCAPAVLMQLPRSLDLLQLGGPCLPPGTMAAVLAHTALRFLSLQCYASALEAPQQLTELRQLTRLIRCSTGDAPVVLPSPCRCAPSLKSYMLFCGDPLQQGALPVPVEVGGQRSGTRSMHTQAPVLAAACQPLVQTAILLTCWPWGHVLMQVAGELLSLAECNGGQLILHHIASAGGLASLDGLLTALLPHGQPISSVLVQGSMLPVPAMQYGYLPTSSPLAVLCALSLWDCWMEGGGWEDGLSALLGRAPSLTRLELRGCLAGVEPLPASVQHATGLSALQLGMNGLRDLPEAPVLAGEAEPVF